MLRYIQGLLGVVLMGGLLWLSYTNGTGYLDKDLMNKRLGTEQVHLSNYDGNGHVMKLPYPVGPKRVLSTYPGGTELLIALGLEDRILATVAPYPPEAEELKVAYSKIPKITAPFVPTKEEVLDVRPDLMMGWNHHFQPNALGDIRNWLQVGIATYIVPATVRKGSPTIESTVYPFIDDMGKLFAIEERAQGYKASLVDRIQKVVDRRSRTSYRPSVMVLQTYGNSTYSLYGKNELIDDVVSKAGGNNVTTKQLLTVGPERVLAYDPDYIVYVSTSGEDSLEKRKVKAVEDLQGDPNLQSLRAVQEGRIILVDFSEVNNGNGRVVDALERIAAALEEEEH